MRRTWNAFCDALTLLTILPCPRFASLPPGAADLGHSICFFPLVGAVVGALLVAVDAAAGRFFTTPARSALVLAAAVYVNGGLHLDGLADTCDGLFSHKDRERVLEIMRDSRIGAHGATALALTLLLEFAFLCEAAGPLRPYVLFFFPVVGRQAMVPAISLHGYARSGPGLGRGYALQAGRPEVGRSLLLTGLLFICAYWLWPGLRQGFVPLLLAATGALLAAGLFARAVAARLGGLTGDVYGAVNQAAELVFLLVAAAYR
ncbi:MAG: adenosylcobinamide-GDP ribazoletransferase [Bacillota bacterium]|nr:adenosylcobinamide-GDP ribazoletransferase [Bacillota bacterium]